MYGNCTSPPANCPNPSRAQIPAYHVQYDPVVGDNAVADIYGLDMRHNILMRRTNMSSGLHIEERYYAHLTRRHLFVHEVQVFNPTENGMPVGSFRTVQGAADKGMNWVPVNSMDASFVGQYGVAVNKELPSMPYPSVATAATLPPPGVQAPLQPGEQRDYVFFQAFTSSIDTTFPSLLSAPASPLASSPLSSTATAGDEEEVVAHCLRELSDALDDQAFVRREHESEWEQRWEQGRIEIDGNLELSQKVNASLLCHLILTSV